MVRVKCSVSYDGSKFHGFQVQNKLRTVQGEIQKALKNICKEEIIIHGSGRTDAKVHGTKQVFHFDTTREMPEAQWKRAINHFLPNDIYILDSYLSTNEYSPFETNYIFQYGRPLDLELMREAAKIFIGEHDFASFCSYDQYGNTIRELYELSITNEKGIIKFILVGNGFRRYMVRHIVGGLIQVGAKRVTKERLQELLDSKGEQKCLFKAKPQGLYLHEVFYDEN